MAIPSKLLIQEIMVPLRFASRMTAHQDVREMPAFAGMTMQHPGMTMQQDGGASPP